MTRLETLVAFREIMAALLAPCGSVDDEVAAALAHAVALLDALIWKEEQK